MQEKNKMFVIVNNNIVSVNILCDSSHMASAELSHMPDSNNELYFNRLIVPVGFRNKGFATKILNKVENIVDEHKLNILLDINAYGDLNAKQLFDLYERHGFVKHHKHDMIRKFK
jgi:predicted GNAT family N-acyltransferase